VIFRRGPSKQVEVIRWDLSTDTFERGHWFRGRIYARRCDLSPDGTLLVYFASKFDGRTVEDQEYTYAWTAVSRAPWLTALALWPKGDCWWGGGLFTSKRGLWLNHKPDEATPHPAHRPHKLKVEPNPEAHGEDEPIYSRRLERDGWATRRAWEKEWLGIKHCFRTLTPGQHVKTQPRGTLSIVLERRIDRLTYRESFTVEGASAAVQLPPGPLEWLDWDDRNRLIALSGGRVWAASTDGTTVLPFAELLDLREDRFEERVAPAEAQRW
jgi:hypothetical protein